MAEYTSWGVEPSSNIVIHMGDSQYPELSYDIHVTRYTSYGSTVFMFNLDRFAFSVGENQLRDLKAMVESIEGQLSAEAQQ